MTEEAKPAVTQEQFDALTKKLSDTEAMVNRLTGRLEATPVTPAQPKKEEPVYTRAQVSKAVQDGIISQDAADQILDEQLERKILGRVKSQFDTLTNRIDTSTAVSRQIEKYQEGIADLDKEGSENREKVRKEYTFLVENGMDPKSKATELAALKAAFGHPKNPVGTAKQDPHMGSDSGGEDTDAPPKSIKFKDARQRKHYTKLIDDGYYKDWNEVREELKYAKG